MAAGPLWLRRWVRSLKESHFSETPERFSARKFQTRFAFWRSHCPVEKAVSGAGAQVSLVSGMWEQAEQGGPWGDVVGPGPGTVLSRSGFLGAPASPG